MTEWVNGRRKISRRTSHNWNTLNKELAESGELVAVEGLAFPDQAKLVRGRKDGTPAADGVFPESKEFLAGYWIVDVETPDRAYAIAAMASAAPGPGGAPLDAITHYRIAAGRAASMPERNYLMMQAARLSESTASPDRTTCH